VPRVDGGPLERLDIEVDLEGEQAVVRVDRPRS
jgi:hypothetical protein